MWEVDLSAIIPYVAFHVSFLSFSMYQYFYYYVNGERFIMVCSLRGFIHAQPPPLLWACDDTDIIAARACGGAGLLNS